MMKLSPAAHEALSDAMCKRGPRKGLLLSSAPRMNTMAYAAWAAAMMNVNPFKVGMIAQILMTKEQRVIYDEIDLCWMSLPPKMQAVLKYGLDKDRRALEDLGAW
jgi:hypothetical protein